MSPDTNPQKTIRFVYLDNNATSSVDPRVIDAMMPYFVDQWGNPSSMHRFGGHVAESVEQARAQVAALIGAEPSDIIFTGCGTESDNTAIRGAVDAMGAGTPIVTSRVEHLAVLAPCRRLGELGHRLIELPVDSVGQLDLAALREAVYGGDALVSLMWANNETGVLFPMDEIAAIVKSAGCVLHTDAIQAVGKIPINLQRTPVDMLSISGHKLHAPKGIGALFIRRGTRLRPFLLGGHQERGLRGGTENVPYIVALGKACEIARETMDAEMKRIRDLRDRLEEGLLSSCPDTSVNGDREHRLPNTSNISFAFIEGEAILYHLSDLGIAASSGSACTSGSLEPSHVIRAMGVPFTTAHGSIRFSLSRDNSRDDIDYVLREMPPVIQRLRELSPFVARAS